MKNQVTKPNRLVSIINKKWENIKIGQKSIKTGIFYGWKNVENMLIYI